MNLRTKTILLFAILIVLLLGISWWTQRTIIEQSLRNSILSGAESLSRSSATTISNFLNDKLRNAKAIAFTLPESTLINKDAAKVEIILQRMQGIFPDFENGLFLLSENGELWADYPPHPETRGKSFASRDYFQKTIQANRGIIGAPYRSARTDQPVITFTEILRDSSGKLLGILGCSVKLNSSGGLGIISQQKFGETGYVYVYDRSRRMILHPDASRILKSDVPKGANRLFDAAIEGFEGVGETVNSRNVPMLLALTAVPGSDWIVGAQQPMAEALAPLYEARKRLAIVVVLCVIAAALVGAVAIRRITHPLMVLNHAVSGLDLTLIGKGQEGSEGEELRQAIQGVSKRKDEIGGLATTFLKMDEKLADFVATLSKIATEWQRTFDTVESALFIVDANQKVIRLNQAASRLVKLDFSEALGENLSVILFGSENLQNASLLNLSEKAGKVTRFDSCDLRAEGIYEITGTQMQDETGKASGAIYVVRDITEKTVLEKSLRESSKMTALGTMAGGIAHDFNNILSAIMGYAEILKMKLKDDPRQTRFAMEIIKAGERGATLIRSLMTYSRKEVQQATTVDLNTLLQGLETMMVRLGGEAVKVNLQLADAPANFWGQRGQLEQVVINLVVNAKDAMPSGGTITLSTCIDKSNGPTQPAKIILEVKDTGEGLDPKIAEKIFDPFYTTKPLGKGTGLGLSIVQGIIHSHHGEITVQSRPGQGTSFRITLPTSQESAATIEDLPLLQNGKPSAIDKDLCILFVDDDTAVRESCRSVLEEYGWNVICAEGPAEALQVFKRMQDEINLLITDVIMPEMNGYELAQKLQEVRPDLQVIYLSGYSSESLQDKAILSTELSILEKPFSPMELCRLITEILRS